MSELLNLSVLEDVSNDEIVTSDLYLEEPLCLDGDEVHYVHLPSSLEKKIFQHKFNVAPDKEFLTNEGKSIAKFPLLQQEFDPFEADTYSRLTGIIDCSNEFDRNSDAKIVVAQRSRLKDIDSVELVADYTRIIISGHESLPDVEKDWRLDAPLIENHLSSRLINETVLDEYWKQTPISNLHEELLTIHSCLETVDDFLVPISTVVLKNISERDEVDSTCINVTHRKLQDSDQLDGSRSSLSKILEGSWPRQEVNPQEVNSEMGIEDSTGTSLFTAFSNDSEPNSGRRESELALASCSIEVPKRCDYPTSDSDSTEVSLNVIRNTKVNVNCVRDVSSSVDEETACRLSEKDAFNYCGEEARDDSNLSRTNSDTSLIITLENVKAKDEEQTEMYPRKNDDEAEESGEKECRKFNKKMMGKAVVASHTSSLTGADSKIKHGVADELSLLKKFTDPQMKRKAVDIPIKTKPLTILNEKRAIKSPKLHFKPHVEEKVRKNKLINIETKETRKKISQTHQQTVKQIELKQTNLISGGDGAKSNQLASSEVEIKAIHLKHDDTLAHIRDEVLAKFNDWVIDIDWNDDNLGLLPSSGRASSSALFAEKIEPGHEESQAEPVNVQQVAGSLTDNELAVSGMEKPKGSIISKKWKFKKEIAIPKQEGRLQGPNSDVMDVFCSLRQLPNPKHQAPVVTKAVPNKKRKIDPVKECFQVQENRIEIPLLDPSELTFQNKGPGTDANRKSLGEPTDLNCATLKKERNLKDDNYFPVKIICSSAVAEDAELINLLETRYNLSFVVRDHKSFVLDSELNTEMCNPPDFIIDERTAMLLTSMKSLCDPQQFLKLKKKLYSLVLSYCVCWVLLVNESNDEPSMHSEVLKMYSKLSVLSTQFNMVVKDFQNKLIICKNAAQAAEYIRVIIDHTLRCNAKWDFADTSWTKRDWLLPNASAHEKFLSKFPSLSAFHIQIMLGTTSLRCLLQASLEELQKMLPDIPIKCLENFHKLVHKRFSGTTRSDEHGLEPVLNTEMSTKPFATALPIINRRVAAAAPPISPVIPTVRNENKQQPNQLQEFRGQPRQEPSLPSTNYPRQDLISSHICEPDFETSSAGIYPSCSDVVSNNYSVFPGFGQFRPVSYYNLYNSPHHLYNIVPQQPVGYVRGFDFSFYSERPPLRASYPNSTCTTNSSPNVLYNQRHPVSDYPVGEHVTRPSQPRWHKAFNFSDNPKYINYNDNP